MERLSKGNHFVPIFALHLLLITTCHFDRRFVRFSAAVAEKDRVSAGVGCQQGCCLFLSWNLEQVRYVPQLIDLSFQLRSDFLRCMAQARHSKSAHEIEIAVPLIVP
ncbi:hypothetical protein D3C74_447890 [compost metagenome]